jgi:2-polyprenyl-6-methoxyphenol hydroxylase-like FAD-dependent oxidoreductase
MTPRLHIGIAGAGMGGLACAIALHLAGHRVRLFDRFERPRPVGSGLVVQPVGQRVLDWLGAGDTARALGQPITRLYGREARIGIETLNVRYDAGAPGRQGLGIHRAALFEALHARLTALGLRVEPLSEVTGTALAPQGRVLHLADGRREGPFDLIVDALGLHSPLSPLVGRTLPYGALWTTLDWPEGTDIAPDRLSQRYVAARRMVGVLPVGRLPGGDRRKATLFWSLRADALEGWRAAGLPPWKAEMLALWPALAPFVAQITDPAQMIFARYAHGTLGRPWSERLVHIGDAAHRASPQLGQGANMALLDALALARALDTAPLDEALPHYWRTRRGHLRLYQGFSRFLTPLYQHDSAVAAWVRDRVVAPASRLPPMPRALGAIASGCAIPPLAGEPHAAGAPVPPAWAMDGAPSR